MKKKKNIKGRALSKYCFCSGAKLWELGFKEGQFLHAWGCPLRRNKEEIETVEIIKVDKRKEIEKSIVIERIIIIVLMIAVIVLAII